MIIVLWIAVPIVSYLFIAGILRAPFAKLRMRRCGKCVDGVHEWTEKVDYRSRTRKQNSVDFHSEDAAIYAAFWPFTLPWTAGSMLTGSDRKANKAIKAEARRAEEIAEAEHQVELARLRKRENDFLDQHLKLAEISKGAQDR